MCMAPLTLEMHVPAKGWIKIGEARPGDPTGSISDNKPDGSRDIYMFVCLPDDSKSVIYHSRGGVDTEMGPLRVVSPTGVDIIKELKKGGFPL